MAKCRMCKPPEDIPDAEVMAHLRRFHPGWDDPGPPVTDVTAPFEHPVMTAADLKPHGARCTGCGSEFHAGDRYAERLLAFIGDTPAVEIICLACAGEVTP